MHAATFICQGRNKTSTVSPTDLHLNQQDLEIECRDARDPFMIFRFSLAGLQKKNSALDSIGSVRREIEPHLGNMFQKSWTHGRRICLSARADWRSLGFKPIVGSTQLIDHFTYTHERSFVVQLPGLCA